MKGKRKIFDILRNGSTCFSAFITVLLLFAIIIYVLFKGAPNLSWQLITSDYKEELVTVKLNQPSEIFANPKMDEVFFSNNYGIGFKDGKTVEGKPCIRIAYVATSSPFKNINVKENVFHQTEIGETVDVLIGENSGNDVICDANDGAKKFSEALDQCEVISHLQIIKDGGGIRGSLITTLYLIVLSLVLSLPLGIGASIYLVLYAREGKLKTIITNMIDSTSGIPSIIFGFVGMLVFIPFVSTFTNINSYSIIAGALTMTIILLPTIIKTTGEALLTVPSHYMSASLALGASKTQTIFKVILPNALVGIITSALLSIGRIIGESAALIFVLGTSIEDNITLLQGSTSLSLHIWSITKQEVPNYGVACAISIIILLVVFLMNITVKIISYKLNKKRGV